MNVAMPPNGGTVDYFGFNHHRCFFESANGFYLKYWQIEQKPLIHSCRYRIDHAQENAVNGKSFPLP